MNPEENIPLLESDAGRCTIQILRRFGRLDELGGVGAQEAVQPSKTRKKSRVCWLIEWYT
jgi:hypothetical protein